MAYSLFRLGEEEVKGEGEKKGKKVPELPVDFPIFAVAWVRGEKERTRKGRVRGGERPALTSTSPFG